MRRITVRDPAVLERWRQAVRSVPPADRQVRWSFKVDLLTPAYGGGVEPGSCEQDRPFRLPSIRVQLRFWWRATQGANYPASDGDGGRWPIDQLRRDEAAIWGMASVARDDVTGKQTAPVPSSVRIRIENDASDKPASRPVRADTVPLNSGQGYVYFPAREITGAHSRPASSYWWGRSATVHLTLDLDTLAANLGRLETRNVTREDAPRQVAAALWAFGHFGGIGARTRRGAGALRLTDIRGPFASLLDNNYDADPAQVMERIERASREFVRGEVAQAGDFPALKGAALTVVALDLPGRILPIRVPKRPDPVRIELSDPERILSVVGGLMREFRQDDRFARLPGSGPRPGRSKWPEPDAIRTLVGQWARPAHEPRLPVFFPRAAFGLPIVVKFNTREPHQRGDPEGQVTIRPAGGLERLASPVVLRPLPCKTNGKTLVACLLLNTPIEPPGGLVVDYGREYAVPRDATPLGGTRHAPTVEPLRVMGHPIANEAFRRFVSKKGPQRSVQL